VLDPVGQRLDLRGDVGAHGRQAVLDVGRHDRVGGPQHEAVALQRLQRLRQHLLAHAADPVAQGAETVRAAQQRHQDQHAPAAGHVLQHLP
jgi:hypothetical protein